MALNLVLFGDVLHRRAPLPAWRIEDLRASGPGTPRLRLVLPDVLAAGAQGLDQVSEPGLGLLPVMSFENALRISRKLLPDAPWPGAPPGRRRSSLRDVPKGAWAIDMLALRPCASVTLGILALERRVAAQLRGRDPWELGPAVAEARSRAWRSASTLRLAVHEPTFDPQWPWRMFYPDTPDHGPHGDPEGLDVEAQ